MQTSFLGCIGGNTRFNRTDEHVYGQGTATIPYNQQESGPTMLSQPWTYDHDKDEST